MKKKWEVVILGGGFAGLACARRLEKLWGKDTAKRVLLVSAENYFVYQPFLSEVIGAGIEPRHVMNPIRLALRRCTVQRAEVTTIDLEKRRVEFNADEGISLEPVEAEHLVIALGSSTNLRAIPGMMEHGLFLKTLADALGIREHIIKRLEEADLEPNPDIRRSLLHFVVVGGGYSGVETAGEILDLLHDARRFYPSFDPSELRVTLVHSGAHLLPELGEDLGRFAQRFLESRGMTVLLNQRASSVSAGYIRLNDGTRLESRNPICTIGNAPNPVLKDLAAEYANGWLVTNEFLRLKGHTHLWGIGDGAANPDGYGNQCPPTAQFAIQLGRHAAENIALSSSGKPLRSFRYKTLGQMATIGHHKGVCSIFGFQFSGFLAWWVTRTVHLLKLPGLDRKLRVVVDWTFELFFPPDLNYLDLKKTQKIARIHVEPGDVIFRQGERGSAFYIVEDGTLEATRYDGDGKVLWRDEVLPGDHFGEGSFLYGVVRRVTVTAKTGATLMVFNSKEFKSFVESFQTLSQILRHTAQRPSQEDVLGEARWTTELLSSPVEAVMKKSVPCLSETATINEAILAFGNCSQTLLPIVDAEGKMTGILTKTDVYRAMTLGQDFGESVETIAKHEVAALREGQTVREALRVLYMKDVKQAPVLDDRSRPVGILSHLDLAEARIHLDLRASGSQHASSVDTPE
ncbi:FAD-dependent oxidoreductase [Candidatus Nitrospira allomarina]|uniref:NADH:ubiquinone reductase (non-electrogenic) n=1 Tax=Candidatus Nitrospira allomarina TaxID=3020900 RepID=A0AA96GAS5_9BACT|nr:FAD-dependent oxidoreductase [Candidatus Nitrospira allomarina]WNM57592.1 FAD-dependent oxidoreductase [Candidatus Nitrospira allomarina]